MQTSARSSSEQVRGLNMPLPKTVCTKSAGSGAAAKFCEGNLPNPWTCSAAKRIFDCVCVLLALPVLVPLALAIAAVVRITSPGPVLFLQKRVGRYGSVFTILKFRTMMVAPGDRPAAVFSA
jgi:lipopolysaccharide/colanic/teichoic acid biosynthesis glycosyltransferase